MKNSDKIRAALIATAQSMFPVLNLMGVLDLTSDEISIMMLAINNAVTLIFLLVPSESDPQPPAQPTNNRPAWPRERRDSQP